MDHATCFRLLSATYFATSLLPLTVRLIRRRSPVGAPGRGWVAHFTERNRCNLPRRAHQLASAYENLPLWSDECFLSVNFIDRGYRERLEPLDNGQIAPPLFLWAQRFSIDLGGFSELSLRFFRLVCGLASVFLFCHLARRVFGLVHGGVTLTALSKSLVSPQPDDIFPGSPECDSGS